MHACIVFHTLTVSHDRSHNMSYQWSVQCQDHINYTKLIIYKYRVFFFFLLLFFKKNYMGILYHVQLEKYKPLIKLYRSRVKCLKLFYQNNFLRQLNDEYIY